VSDYAGEMSAALLGEPRRFGLMGIGADLGHGARYIDRRQQQVWLGGPGAREAIAYYYGVAEAAHVARDGSTDGMPQWLAEVGAQIDTAAAGERARGGSDFRAAREMAAAGR